MNSDRLIKIQNKSDRSTSESTADVEFSVYGFITESRESEGEALSFEEAKKLQAKILAIAEEDNQDKAVNAAASLMMEQKFVECIKAYELIMAKFPDEQGTCESQIGACHYFLGNYEQAIAFYVAAREHGADANMMDDNIWEACETLHEESSDRAWMQNYLDLCPEGNYIEIATQKLTLSS